MGVDEYLLPAQDRREERRIGCPGTETAVAVVAAEAADVFVGFDC